MRKFILFILLAVLLLLTLYPKKCDSMYHVLPSEMVEEKGLIDSVCICVGYRINTLTWAGGPSEGLCFGIPIKYCKGYIEGEYKIVKCK